MGKEPIVSIGRINCATNPKTDETVFHIFCGNFKFEEAPSTTFKYEIVAMSVVAAHQDLERDQNTALCESIADVAPNFGGLLQEIVEICHQGIELDDGNKPSPENAQPSATETQTIGQWETPTITPRRSYVNCHNTKGVWRQHSLPKNSDMMELSLFRMKLPEKYVRDVLIPATNEESSGDEITLKEFYLYLGCHFFMACFKVISDRRLWWYPKPVSIREGSPFRLHKYMALWRFISINSAMK